MTAPRRRTLVPNLCSGPAFTFCLTIECSACFMLRELPARVFTSMPLNSGRLLTVCPSLAPCLYWTIHIISVAGVVGPRHVITVSKEIILSAGSIGTPHILLHSGIGDRNALSALGVKLTHHLPSVGQNFTEQPAAIIHWLVNDNNTYERFTRNTTLMAEILEEWKVNKSGPLTGSASAHLGYMRLPENASVFETVSDPSAGPNTPHVELSFNVSIVLTICPQMNLNDVA